MNRKLAIVGLLALPLSAFAEEAPAPEEKPALTGSAELGLLYKTGNTHSGDLKTGFDLRYEQDKWLSLLDFNFLKKKSDVTGSVTIPGENGADDTTVEKTSFITTDQRWNITSQTNYTLEGDKNYVYGNIWYEDNDFNSFKNQSSISTGWGRHWYKNEKASLWADIGPGYKRDVVKAKGDVAEHTDSALIIQAQALYLRTLNENVEFKQTFSAKYAVKSGENSIYKAESSITTKLISTLQLKFTFSVDYNSEVDEDKENTDTQTAVTLVYSF